MRRWLAVGASVVGGVAATTMAAAAIGNTLWNRGTTRAIGRLRAQPARRGTAAAFLPDQLAGLPAPVARYFQFALTPLQPLIRGARILSEGDFLAGPGQTWKPFTADQHFTVQPPGFVWDAAIKVAPLLPVHVRDSYMGGEGSMYGSLAAVLPIVEQRATPEIAMGSLHRYLAEAVWLPTALLPSCGVAWNGLDGETARATLTDGDYVVSANFHFGAHGEVVSISAERFRDVKGIAAPTPWVVQLRDYQRVHGMMVPCSGEVAWLAPEGRQPYWRGRITSFEYEFIGSGT